MAFPQLGVAGGNTSIVAIDKVTSVKVEEKKIIIRGSAVIKRRVMSTKEKGDGTVFGQPAQWLHAKVDDCVFEVIPYFGRPDIEGVPTGGHSEEELKRLSDKWWVEIHAVGKKIKMGDAVGIGYQGDITTINGVRVSKIVGYGSITIAAAKQK